MNRKIFILFTMTCGVFVFEGCHKALNLSPDNSITDEQMWQDQGLVTLYLNNFYSQLRSGFGNETTLGNGSWLLSCITDDAMAATPSTGSGAPRYFVNDAYTTAQSPMNTLWGQRYTYIRRANLFMANIDHVPGDPALNKRLKAEMRFLRAYYYYDLVSFFGGVPIITTAQSASDSLLLPRNTLADCYIFIISQLDSAAADLPSIYPASDIGRITQQAAWGIKCRIQMVQQNWAGAAATAQNIMNLGINVLLSDYTSVFTTPSTTNNPEIILAVQHDNSKDELGTNFDKNTWTPYAGGYGYNCPTQNLVDNYEMQTTGKAITDPASGYNPNYPYAGRDPRFAATILFDGAMFKNRNLQMYTGGVDVNPMTPGNSAATVSPTGYYLKKFTNQNVNILDPNARSYYNWPLIRYAEILLNYAESHNEAVGPDASVYSAVNAVRQRSGMPAVGPGLAQDQMRTVIRHERRIELAFEDFRYWDALRWGIADSLFTGSRNPIRRVTISIDPATGLRTSYTYSNVPSYNNIFLQKNYLFPIPTTEVSMPDSKLVQNPGW